MRSFSRPTVLTFALVIVFCASALTQTGTSEIRGTVVDPQGRVVSGADIKITNMDTGAVRTNKSTETGVYVFDLLPPANYRLEVEAAGFKKQVTTDIQALIGKQTDVKVTLEVGAQGTTVEVQASAQEALINTQDATLGNNFDSLQITQLPLEARNLVDTC